MKFLVDECTGPAVAHWLRQQGYDVFSVYDQARGSDDSEVMDIAGRDGRILITNDRGFGERFFVNDVNTTASFFFVWTMSGPLIRSVCLVICLMSMVERSLIILS